MDKKLDNLTDNVTTDNNVGLKRDSFEVENSPTANPPIETKTPPQNLQNKQWVKDLLSFIGIILFVVIPFRIFIAQPYLVDGSSMDPTFKDNEYLIVDQLSYRLGDPKRGDVIIFKYPINPKQYFIKRVIGLPGETVILSNEGTIIKNGEHPDGLKLDEPYVVFKKDDSVSLTLKDDQYFVLGDNRPASSDSRFWGAVPRKNIMGRPFVSLFPLDKISFMPGSLGTFEN